MDGPEFEEQSGEEQSNGEEGSEYEGSDEPQTKRRRAPRKPVPKDTRKRARDDEEAEAHSEKERKERDARLRRERSAEAGEARSRRSQKLAEEKAERERKVEEERKLEQQRKAEQERKAEQQRKAAQRKAEREQKAEEKRKAEQQRKAEEQQKAEQEQLAAQVAREQAARAAMPPPPQPLVPRPAPDMTLTPNNLAIPMDLDPPGSARSFVEESNLFQDANVQTPTPPPPKNTRRTAPAAPPSPPRPVKPLEEVQLPTSPPAEHPSPPSVLKRPPRRPGGTTPASRLERPGPNLYRGSIPQTPPASGSPELEDEQEQSSQETLADPYATLSFEYQLRNRLKPQEGKGKADAEEEEEQVEQAENLTATGPRDYHPRWSDVKGSFSLRSVLKVVAGAFVLLHLIRLTQTFVRPDLFDAPILTLNWYGWNDWANNVGQFFPSPLLHSHGVLTDDQYDDLKEYLQRRTSRTEAAVDNLKSVLPKVVSVKKDNKGKIIIADEFWAALKALIQHDNSILSLDGKSQVSEQHWKAIEQRLKKAGLLDKPLSADDVARIVDKSAPASWEKWLEKNKQKVADIIGQDKGSSKGPPKGTNEAVVSKDEFMRELTDRLAKSKKEVDIEMGGLRKELDGVLQEVKKLASDGGMTKTETLTLINKVVDKEIVRRLAQIGSRPGAAKIDAMFSNRVNFFSPGNNAQIDISLSSPTYELDAPPLLSHKWLKSMRWQPQFLQDKSQALRPWSDPGHCWCAATLGHKNRTHPATLAVQLPRFVIPQQVVLEHIDPAATTDPLAMPRDVEVWARIEDPDHQDRVLDWMSVQFPADLGPPRNDKLIDQGFAKIGHFTYDHRPKDEGIYVHQLSRDLVDRLRAATDLVVLRAVSNYGAKDHTCFYRVRLYGDEVEDLEAE